MFRSTNWRAQLRTLIILTLLKVSWCCVCGSVFISYYSTYNKSYWKCQLVTVDLEVTMSCHASQRPVSAVALLQLQLRIASQRPVSAVSLRQLQLHLTSQRQVSAVALLQLQLRSRDAHRTVQRTKPNAGPASKTSTLYEVVYTEMPLCTLFRVLYA